MQDPKNDLEKQADKLLEDTLKDTRRNKIRLEEYPILSDTQLKRRRAREIPMSSLSIRQKLESELNNDPDDL
mgnify:CR=1 FL=1